MAKKDKIKQSIDSIKCPNCGEVIPITEAFQQQITERVKLEYDKKFDELHEKEKSLEGQQERLKQEIEDQLEKEKVKIQKKFKKDLKKEYSMELNDVKEQLDTAEKELSKSKKTELQLRKRERELEKKQQEIELEVERKLSKEKEKYEKEILKNFSEKQNLKDKEKDKKISDMMQQIDDLQRKGLQGSSQLKGEVQELEIEAFLSENFPLDTIEPVPKGITGADCIQRVHSKTGLFCGIIVWESKRTIKWNNNWLTKLKDDMVAVQGNLGVIVTETLPKDIDNFDIRDEIWVCDYSSFQGLVTVLREWLIQLETTRIASKGKDEKMEVLFRYLTGAQFRQRVEAITDSFGMMKDDLEKEKRTAFRRWSKREKQIGRIIENTSCMYGDLQGLIGSSMQTIKALEEGDDELLNDDDE